MSDFKIKWHDSGREPQCKPNPAFPEGVDLDCSHGQSPACKADLPYPAKRCGFYLVECIFCGTNVAITTAGRPDDPRSVVLPCERGRVQ